MSPQELQRRVRADDEQLELLRQIARDQAVMRGHLERLLIRQHKSPGEADRVALDVLAEAAYRAMGVTVWTVGELLSRTLTTDPEGLELDAAIRGTGRDTARRLGRFLASLVPAEWPHYTDSGLELRRCGTSPDGVVIWTVGRV
jgi:hypothetical protein